MILAPCALDVVSEDEADLIGIVEDTEGVLYNETMARLRFAGYSSAAHHCAGT